MSQKIQITYYHHSGFSVEIGKTLLIFDYWTGEHGELPADKRITEEYLNRFDYVHVFISHEHPDHFDPVVYEWRGLRQVDYIVSDDMPVGTRGKRMKPGSVFYTPDEMKVTAFPSTDLGVSFLVKLNGVTLFHAGDLNFWHWRDESTVREIAEAEADFQAAVATMLQEHIDVAFFPVDPRQGEMYEAGANYFIMTIKPRILLPMHFWGRADMMEDFRRHNGTDDTVIMTLSDYGEQMGLEFEDDGYITVTADIRREATGSMRRMAMGNPVPASSDVNLSAFDELDPFGDTDLPVALDALDNPQEEK